MNSTSSDLPVHILLPSLARGGAERIVCEVVATLESLGFPGNLFLLFSAERRYDAPKTSRFRVVQSRGGGSEQGVIACAESILDSRLRLVLTHMIPVQELRILWSYGVQTVPVIHNARPGWQDDPARFAHDLVPFVVATSLAVARELDESKCPKPIVVVRHELQRWFTSSEMERDRRRIRAQYGIADEDFVVGMVGNFKAQKAYPRAVRVLDRLRRLGPARLLVLGSWDHSYGYGETTYTATCNLAHQLGCMGGLILAGSVPDVKPYYAAFDAFLNTSVYEGLSIAMLEAQQAGCPVVTADAGGNIEGLTAPSRVVYDASDIQSYVDALTAVRPHRVLPRPQPAYPALIPRLWRQLALHSNPHRGDRVLFVTNGLNNGGATHSLVNLLTRFAAKDRIALCVLGSNHNPALFERLKAARIRIVQFDVPAGVLECADRVLEALHACAAGILCFWHVDSYVKLLVTKVLTAAQTKIVDVSPGPCFFSELAETEAFQHRIAFTATEYFARLDRFVAKYSGGVPPAEYGVPRSKVSVVPNGVPCPPEPDRASLPTEFAEAFRLVTCSRLVPEKRLEFVIDAAAEVGNRLPAASLTVVGGAEGAHNRYAESLARRAERRAFRKAWFTGRQTRVTPFLNAARVFVTASTIEGCSNAVLEAMSAGLPVVATFNGAVTEQVTDGATGFVVPGAEPGELAEKITVLLRNPEMARAFGDAGRRRVSEEFAVERMVNGYAAVLGCE